MDDKNNNLLEEEINIDELDFDLEETEKVTKKEVKKLDSKSKNNIILITLILVILLSVFFAIFYYMKNRTPELKTETMNLKVEEMRSIENDLSEKEQNKLIYRSDNKDVATVDSKGMVKALSEGKATIYVRYKGAKQEYVKVFVESNIKDLEIKEGEYLSLKRGETKKLTLIGEELDSVKFESANPKIAYVKGKNLIAVDYGETTIIAKNKLGAEATIKVVVKSAVPLVENIVSEDMRIKLKDGKQKLNFKYEPKNAYTNFTYEVSDNKIIEVDKRGYVTPLNIGEAKVRIVSHNGPITEMKVRVSA